jgi:hypothetical protein
VRFCVVSVHEKVSDFGIGLRQFVESASDVGIVTRACLDFCLGLFDQRFILIDERFDGVGISFLHHFLSRALKLYGEVQ